ncbi:heterokaryon incompatibility protein-domain-containing protein [Annulohypoxylon bovei var. microspora]|nr:heterokaryon incompatibility protein-domain-containing protein [Annulohypoxylon bovei var. microspora]
MSLCGPCTGAFRGKTLTAGVYYNHHPSWASFVAAADEKCDVCWRIFDALTERQQDRLRNFGEVVGNDTRIAASGVAVAVGTSGYVNVEFTYNLAVEASRQRSRGLIDISTEKELDDISNFLLSRCQKLPFLPSDVGNDFVKPINETSTFSASAWGLVLSWLRECKSTHERCASRRNNSGWYPTRLLDVQSPPTSLSSKTEVFRIVDGSDIPSGLDYVTLSHRWGSAKMPRLTVTEMPRYRGGALVSELPATFRDAITITRRLGVRYIWIDSLCIIQEGDDGQDWRREGTQMAQIYSNCLMNISADWSSGGDGLFFSRKLESFRKFELELRITVGKQRGSRKRQRTTKQATYTHVPVRNLEQVDTSPLAGRGWVFQERILSPIVLHFGRREVIWDCCEKLASESLPQGLSNISFENRSLVESAALKRLDPSGDPHWTHLLSLAFGSSLKSSTIRDTPYLLWWFLTRQYCRCALTYASDRLVAISGVARYLKSIIKDQYIAGMWRRYLAIEMGWKVKSQASERHLQGPTYTGPSFSWTSVQGVIEPGNPVYDDSLTPCVEVEPVQLLSSSAGSTADRYSRKPVTGDIFGPLTEPGIQIQVRGNLKSARMLRSQGRWLVVPLGNLESDGHTYEESKGVLASLDFVLSEIEEAKFQRLTFFYVPWCTFSNGHLTNFMLLELQNAQEREFRRIGFFTPGGFGAHELTETFLRNQPDQCTLPGYDDITGRSTVFIV